MRMKTSIAIFTVLTSATMATAQESEQESQARQGEFKQLQEKDLAEALKALPPEEGKKLLRHRAASEAAVRHINGKQTPDLVPYWLRMRGFFDAYERIFKAQLAPRLSAADVAVLNEYVQKQHATDRRKSSESQSKAQRGIEAQAKNMSAIEIAIALKAATDRNQAQQGATYRAVMRQLSVDGQKIVNDFAYANIRPSFSIYDPIEAARLEPELYKEQIVRTYEAEQKRRVSPSAASKPPLRRHTQGTYMDASSPSSDEDERKRCSDIYSAS
jgi:hypothetical protein